MISVEPPPRATPAPPSSMRCKHLVWRRLILTRARHLHAVTFGADLGGLSTEALAVPDRPTAEAPHACGVAENRAVIAHRGDTGGVHAVAAVDEADQAGVEDRAGGQADSGVDHGGRVASNPAGVRDGGAPAVPVHAVDATVDRADVVDIAALAQLHAIGLATDPGVVVHGARGRDRGGRSDADISRDSSVVDHQPAEVEVDSTIARDGPRFELAKIKDVAFDGHVEARAPHRPGRRDRHGVVFAVDLVAGRDAGRDGLGGHWRSLSLHRLPGVGASASPLGVEGRLRLSLPRKA